MTVGTRSRRRNRTTERPPGRGLLLVFTGNGKGKTTAALGAALRAIGHGWRVLMAQFIKGTWKTGEDHAAKLLRGRLRLVPMGAGFVRNPSSAEKIKHRRAACAALEFAVREGLSGRYGLVILDELNCAVSLGLLRVSDCIKGVKRLLSTPAANRTSARRRPLGPKVNVIVTGRDAPRALLRAADTVSEMIEVKHPFQNGIGAQKGLDF